MTSRTKRLAVQCTDNYELFTTDDDNRDVNLKRHTRLLKSMQKYGFLKAYPIVCRRDEKGKLHIKDGQNRFVIARSLKLPIWWIEDDSHFQIDEINNTQVQWCPNDYAQKFARNGNRHYQAGLEFCERHGLPLSMGFAMLGGTCGFKNIQQQFRSGKFIIKDEGFADRVAGVYVGMTALCKSLRHSRFLEACISVCRVDGFDPNRLLRAADRCREKLVSYSTKDGNLEMVEEVYNFGNRKLVPLKIKALEAMRSRNPRFNKERAAKGHFKLKAAN